MNDFYISKYKELLEVIKEENIKVYSVQEWLDQKPSSGILLRHDVDRFPQNVFNLSKLEKSYGISGTYYLRKKKGIFSKKMVSHLVANGHEVGYHYEDLSFCKGNYQKAIDRFADNLRCFRTLTEVQTIAMHGSALSPYHNLDLWNKYNWSDFNLKGEAFLSIDYSDFHYFTDTGRSWSSTAVNLRDKVASNQRRTVDGSTDHLMDFIVRNKNKKIALVVHPERWPSSFSNFILSYITDLLINIIKRFLIIFRNKK